jgi:hypothetical protein
VEFEKQYIRMSEKAKLVFDHCPTFKKFKNLLHVQPVKGLGMQRQSDGSRWDERRSSW